MVVTLRVPTRTCRIMGERSHLDDVWISRTRACERSASFQRLQAHARDSIFGGAEGTRGSERQIDDAIRDERPTVVDTHHYRAAVVEVRDLQPGPEGQAPMRRGHRVGIECFAARGALALMLP